MAASDVPSWDDLVEQIRRVWDGRLAPIRPELVHPRVSDRTGRFLTAVGLPTVDVRDIGFVHDERLLSIFSRAGRDYLIVTAEPDYRYGVDLESDGVICLYDRYPADDTLANSSIAAFVLTLGLFHTHLFEGNAGTQASVADAVDTIWDQLDRWDPAAVNDHAGHWSTLLDEYAMEYDD
ncbi:SUKH-4 family immunity protein [Micromonospora sp. NBC_00617]|uniref:SUKH-4 family immunity protein n=1 Tax=Micromonospora sp. NBC_00617 TaxID=2903587 RepID=UPI0030DE9553